MTQRHAFRGSCSLTVAQLPISPRVHLGTKRPCCMLSLLAMQLIPSLIVHRVHLVRNDSFWPSAKFSPPSLNHHHLPLTMNSIPSPWVSLCQLCQQDYVISCRSPTDHFGFHVSSIGQPPFTGGRGGVTQGVN